ncbi:rhomboid family intramembrane serine protease [Pokkaliibacter sp. CJK22405]|uniref:rhomboid family intramembrane serine protease n=1 Tax=Pokkaliibacter sp. CJK22405 TaxID=3384615 RepID=UPI0039856A7F
MNGVLNQLKRVPVTSITLGIALLVTLITSLGDYLPILKWFTIVPIEDAGAGQVYVGSLQSTFSEGEWWRLLTPVFLHFSWLHIIFNGLWIWEAGKRLEPVFGRVWLLLTMVGIGIISNLAQYWTGTILFGGLSGIIYGLLGFIWLWGVLRPREDLGFPSGVFIFMLIWLVMGFFGLSAQLGMGETANMAHLGGLLSGVLLALGSHVIRRRY